MLPLPQQLAVDVAARPFALTSRMQLRQMSITEAPGALVRIWPGEWGAGRLPGWGQCSAVSVPCPPLSMAEHAPVPRRGPRRERGERVRGWFAQM